MAKVNVTSFSAEVVLVDTKHRVSYVDGDLTVTARTLAEAQAVLAALPPSLFGASGQPPATASQASQEPAGQAFGGKGEASPPPQDKPAREPQRAPEEAQEKQLVSEAPKERPQPYRPLTTEEVLEPPPWMDGVSAELKAAQTLREVIQLLIADGLTSPQAIAARCVELKDSVSVLKRATNLEARALRGAKIMGVGEVAKTNGVRDDA